MDGILRLTIAIDLGTGACTVLHCMRREKRVHQASTKLSQGAPSYCARDHSPVSRSCALAMTQPIAQCAQSSPVISSPIIPACGLQISFSVAHLLLGLDTC